jgi:hypothetical protein
MDKKVIIAIVVIAVAALAIPLLSKVASNQPAAPAGKAATDKAAPTAAAPTAAPALNADTLANTKWSLKIKGIPVTVSFMAGGKATASAPILKALAGSETVEGTWTVEGANLTLTAMAKGQAQTGKFQISGDQILVDGQPAQRLP